MKLENVNCLVCHSEDSAPWGEESGYTMVQCQDCKFVYLSPRPDPSYIDEAAQTGVHKTAKGDMVVQGRYSERKVTFFKSRILDLYEGETIQNQQCHWLDIGAGFGEFILASKACWHPDSLFLGTEPCIPKVQKAQSLGIPVRNETLESLNDTYSHISLINVFSHLPDPVAFIRGLKPKLKQGGEIILVTGNGADISRPEFLAPLYLPDHLSFGGESQVTEIFNMTGFEVVSIKATPGVTLLDPLPIALAKNMYRLLTGKQTRPLRVSPSSPYKSLWFRAKLIS